MASGTTPKTPVRKHGGVLQPLVIPPSPFLQSLGYGTGVNVWKLDGSKENNAQNSPWAVKNVRKNMRQDMKNKYQDLLNKEATVLRNLSHENIIGFRDYTTARDGRKCLAMELGGVSLGDMIEERFDNNLGPYSADLILKVTENVAKALQYLHDEKSILHGDIKSYNIVIKNNFESIKLCDFGVSINLDEDGNAYKYIGTPIYSAPECQDGSLKPITSKADIFSLGMVMWEMIALTPPPSAGRLYASDVKELEEGITDLNTTLSGLVISSTETVQPYKYEWWNDELQTFKTLVRRVKYKMKKPKSTQEDVIYNVLFKVVKEMYKDKIEHYKTEYLQNFVKNSRARGKPYKITADKSPTVSYLLTEDNHHIFNEEDLRKIMKNLNDKMTPGIDHTANKAIKIINVAKPLTYTYSFLTVTVKIIFSD